MAKQFFAQNNVQYEEKNVAADVPARDEMVQKSGQMGVPVIEVDGKIIIGFDEPKLSEVLGIRERDSHYHQLSGVNPVPFK
jgi:glutaredoxin